MYNINKFHHHQNTDNTNKKVEYNDYQRTVASSSAMSFMTSSAVDFCLSVLDSWSSMARKDAESYMEKKERKSDFTYHINSVFIYFVQNQFNQLTRKIKVSHWLSYPPCRYNRGILIYAKTCIYCGL